MIRSGVPALHTLRADIPVDPDADEARDWIITELGDPRYQAAQPTWFDELSAAFLEWLGSLGGGTVGGPSGLLLTIVIVIVVAAIVAAFWIFGKPAMNRRSAVGRTLFGSSDDRTADDMRRAAESAAARGDFSLAIEESFRALARGLAERTILATSPGTTAHGFAVKAGATFPDLMADLAAAADVFDRVRYLDGVGSEQEYRLIAALERELRSARAPLPDPVRPGTA